MKDRQQAIGNAAQWAFDKISDRLGQEPTEYTTYRGRESHYKLTDPNNLDDLRWLTFHPDEQSVHFSTLGLEFSMDMKHVLPPRPTRDGVIFESANGRARGMVLHNGHAVFEVFPYSPVEPLESPVSASATQNDEVSVSASGGVPGRLQRENGASGDGLSHMILGLPPSR